MSDLRNSFVNNGVFPARTALSHTVRCTELCKACKAIRKERRYKDILTKLIKKYK
jgi:hypothetical protein